MLASSASLTQLTVTTTPYKAQPLRPPLLSFDGYAGELLVSHHASSRTPLPAHTARKHCSCFSAANSAFSYAPGSSPNIKRTSRRRSLKPKLHSTEPRRPIASPSPSPSRDLPAPTIPDPASSSHTSPGYASLPAAALGVRPRLASERSRTPREQPLTHYSARQYDHDFPPFINAIGAPPSTHKGKVKVNFPIARHSTSRTKTKAKENSPPKPPRKAPRKAPTKALRKDPSKVLEKSRQGQRQRKRKGPQIPTHCNGITPLRMAAAPPYSCTRLPSLQRYIPTHTYYTLATGSSTS